MRRILLYATLLAARLYALDLKQVGVKFSPADQKAAAIPIEEAEKRTGIRWPANTSRSPVVTLKRGAGPAGSFLTAKIRLEANGIAIHDLMARPTPIKTVEFQIPAQATAGGSLDLTWYREPGQGGNGRGNQVAEIWIIKQ